MPENFKETKINLFYNSIGQSQSIYINGKQIANAIPENKKGKGKIMISVNGAFHELDAMTENDKILSGTVVIVVKIENNNILIVEPI